MDASTRGGSDAGTPGGEANQALLEAHRLELEGQLEEALQRYESLLESGNPQAGLLRKHVGNLHFRLGHLRRSREHLKLACEQEQTNAACWHDLGVVQYHLADFEGAVTSLREALKWDSDLHLSYFWLGNALYHMGSMDEGVEAFQELVARYPNFAIARFHLGVIFARQGRKTEAEEEFRKVLMQNPEAAAARFYVS